MKSFLKFFSYDFLVYDIISILFCLAFRLTFLFGFMIFMLIYDLILMYFYENGRAKV